MACFNAESDSVHFAQNQQKPDVPKCRDGDLLLGRFRLRDPAVQQRFLVAWTLVINWESIDPEGKGGPPAVPPCLPAFFFQFR